MEEESVTTVRSPKEYIDQVIVLIRRKNYRNAVLVAKEAYERYPEDPFTLSYYGYLLVLVAKKNKEGVKLAKLALKALKKSEYDKRSSSPMLHLNLGRAHLLSGDKNAAFDEFHRGLAGDKQHKDLTWELKKLGIRRPPVIPFLPRAFFLNRQLGRLRHWLLTR